MAPCQALCQLGIAGRQMFLGWLAVAGYAVPFLVLFCNALFNLRSIGFAPLHILGSSVYLVIRYVTWLIA